MRMHRLPPFGEGAGRVRARAAGRLAAREHEGTRRAVATILQRFPPPPCDDRPVFLLASGWRSGSTLLQRLVMDSGTVFVWGEPYARSDHVRRLASTLRPFGDAWPREIDLYDPERYGDGLEGKWIANLSAPVDAFVAAHRAFLRTLLQPPRPGLDWGMKEVRLGSAQAEYLRMLFPAARLVFLLRNPYAQWRSYRHFGRWHDRWPRTVTSPEEFGAMWARLASGFVTDAARLGAHTVRYEDLVDDPEALGRLGAHLGVSIPRRGLDTRVTGGGPAKAAPAPRDDLRRLRRYVDPLAGTLGYAP